jgi:hypothetical protein
LSWMLGSKSRSSRQFGAYEFLRITGLDQQRPYTRKISEDEFF